MNFYVAWAGLRLQFYPVRHSKWLEKKLSYVWKNLKYFTQRNQEMVYTQDAEVEGQPVAALLTLLSDLITRQWWSSDVRKTIGLSIHFYIEKL